MLLRQTGIIEHSEALYLAARCYAECKEWEECLTLLGDGDDDETSLVEVRSMLIAFASGCAVAPSLLSNMQLLCQDSS